MGQDKIYTKHDKNFGKGERVLIELVHLFSFMMSAMAGESVPGVLDAWCGYLSPLTFACGLVVVTLDVGFWEAVNVGRCELAWGSVRGAEPGQRCWCPGPGGGGVGRC